MSARVLEDFSILNTWRENESRDVDGVNLACLLFRPESNFLSLKPLMGAKGEGEWAR